MWIRIRAVIIEDEPLAAQYLAALLDDTCQVDVIGSAIESEAGLRLCAELRPDAVFVDINLPGKRRCFTGDATAMLPQPPRLVFTTGSQLRAMRGEDTKRNFKHTKRQSSSETTHVVQATIGHLR